ncbi:MAG: hypothetical protein H6734_02280 [Alphaproteobacteria bacterium]|nr:hypothetical protein [Alphaproteobacteria bacterium]
MLFMLGLALAQEGPVHNEATVFRPMHESWYTSGKHVHRIGNVFGLVGGAAVVTSVALANAGGRSDGAASMGVLAGAPALIVGGTLSAIGSVRAARAVGKPTAMGLVAGGLAMAAVPAVIVLPGVLGTARWR